MSKGTCCHAGQPRFHLWDSYGGRREVTSGSWIRTSLYVCPGLCPYPLTNNVFLKIVLLIPIFLPKRKCNWTLKLYFKTCIKFLHLYMCVCMCVDEHIPLSCVKVREQPVRVDSLLALRGTQELELKSSGWSPETFM